MEVTDSTGDILLPDNVLVDITDGSSLLNEEETENVEDNPVLIACEINDEVCLLLDAVRDGVTDSTGVSLLLDVAVKDMADDTMKYIEVLDDERSILDVTLVYCIADIVDVSSLLDATLVEFTEIKEINVLLDATLVNIIDGVSICSLLNVVLIAIADVMVEVIDCTELS